MQDDLPKRIRFAHYFASVAISPEFRENWARYHADLTNEQKDKEAVLARKVSELESKLVNLAPSAETASTHAAIQTTQRQIDALQHDLLPRDKSQLFFLAKARVSSWAFASKDNQERFNQWLKEQGKENLLIPFMHFGSSNVVLGMFLSSFPEIAVQAALDLLQLSDDDVLRVLATQSGFRPSPESG